MPVVSEKLHKAKDKLEWAARASLTVCQEQEGMNTDFEWMIFKLLNKYLVSAMKNAMVHKAVLLEEFNRTTASSNLLNA